MNIVMTSDSRALGLGTLGSLGLLAQELPAVRLSDTRLSGIPPTLKKLVSTIMVEVSWTNSMMWTSSLQTSIVSSSVMSQRSFHLRMTCSVRIELLTILYINTVTSEHSRTSSKLQLDSSRNVVHTHSALQLQLTHTLFSFHIVRLFLRRFNSTKDANLNRLRRLQHLNLSNKFLFCQPTDFHILHLFVDIKFQSNEF